MSHRHRGWYPYPYPIQYPSYGPWWGSERILLVEPDPKPDPCPQGFVLSAATKKCVKGEKPKGGLQGLGGILDNPLNVLVLVGVGYLAYRFGKRRA